MQICFLIKKHSYKSFISSTKAYLPLNISIIDLKKFIIAILDINNKIFVIYIVIQKEKKMLVLFKRQTQIKIKFQVKI